MYAKKQFESMSLKFCSILTAYQLLAVKLSQKKLFVFINLLRACESSYVPNLSSLGCVEDAFPVGRPDRAEWIIMLSSGWDSELGKRKKKYDFKHTLAS